MYLKELTELNGVSGFEENIMMFIREKALPYADTMKVDSIGNLIAFKKGISSSFKVMLSAHMDEVGFMVTGHTDTGFIKFSAVGGIDPRIIPGKRVLIGNNGISGVIGCKPLHLQEKEERGKNIKLKSLCIDIGADKKEEAEKLAPLGEFIAFDSGFSEFGKGCIKAKALDDRVGCDILLEILRERYEFDMYVCFTVQEEIGLRGAEVAANSIKPDLAVVVEGTTCSDVPGVEKSDYSTIFGGGAALTIMDRTSYADKGLVRYIHDLAVKNDIKIQFKQTTTGGNDAGKIQRSGRGARAAIISVPCRYIHSPVSLMNREDYDSCRHILALLLKELGRNPQVDKIMTED